MDREPVVPVESLRRGVHILRSAVLSWLACNAFSFAGSLAFYTLFSLAPTVIIAVAVLGVVLGEPAAQAQIVAHLQTLVGPEAADAVRRAVVAARPAMSARLPALVGAGVLLIGATTVFAQLQYSFNVLWGVTANPHRSSLLIWAKQRLLSLAVVLSIGFVLLVSLVLGVVLRSTFHFLGDWLPWSERLLSGGELAVSLLVAALFFAALFKVLPDVVLGWRDVLPGAAITAVLFSLGRYAIAAYLAYTATASTYGAAASLVLLLLWVYYSSLIVLFGVALTRAHYESRGRTIQPRGVAVRVRRELLEG
ncbi:MAG: membrane protein [Halomonadaceae bacterium T82-2]|nr:MAG: membrane protein [Halomonadaceae bacterium T82-2]